MPAPTAAALAAEIPARTLAQLGGAPACERAVARAVVWTRSRFLRKGQTAVDWGEEVVVEATLKRAEYELWGRAERDAVAADKKQDAHDLLEGYFVGVYDPGAGTDDGGGGASRSVPAAAAGAPAVSPLSAAYSAAHAGPFPRGLWPDVGPGPAQTPR